MHNLVSFNQLASWNNLERRIDEFIDEHELMNSYFECLTECDEKSQSCRRICRSILSS